MNQRHRLAVLIVGVVLLVSANLGAQLTGSMTFTTTFDFTAGNTTFARGTYELRPVNDEPGIVQLVAKSGAPSTFLEVQGDAAQKSSPSELLFKRYGNKYLLKGFWDATSGSGFTTAVTHAEKTHAKTGDPSDHKVAATPASKS